MALKEVAEVSEFKNKDRTLVTIDGVEIGVIHIDKEFYALRNVCPHQHGPVAEGEVQRKIVSEVPPVGERVEEAYEEERWVVRCPCHAWGFSISTGENVADPVNAPSVQVYDTVVEDNSVYVEM